MLYLGLFSCQYCVTLRVGPELCLLQSQPAAGGTGLSSTACNWSRLSARGVGQVTFTLLGLEPGEHTLTFTLKTQQGQRDILEKKLRVVVRPWIDYLTHTHTHRNKDGDTSRG